MNKQQFIEKFQSLGTLPEQIDFPLRSKGKTAAVLIPIVERDELQVLFTVRSMHLKHHAGQVSFPGGRMEPTDPDLRSTALRETHEEIGVPEHAVTVLGHLLPYRTISRYEMTPFLGFIDGPFDLRLDKNEVSQCFEVPLSYLLNMDNHLLHWVRRGQHQHPVVFIPWGDQYIWGATAAIIRNLATYLQRN
ncbi:MAG: CoA pyrophosphatase [Aestuariibacter sp.]